MEYIQDIILDVNSNAAYTTVGAKQSDNNSRIIAVHVTKDGSDYNLQNEGVTAAYFRFRKPDGNAIINTCTVDFENNIIKLVFTAQTLAVAGRGYGDVTLMSGSTILSTVSFIVVIMAAPSVAGQAISSNEFGYLNAVVEDATHTIYEAQAWAEGKRGSSDVFGEDSFNITKESTAIETLSVDETIFKSKVGSRPGLQRVFSFVYSDDGVWILTVITTEGNTQTTSSPEAIGQIEDYGITLGLVGGYDAPNKDDTITVTIKEHDNAYQNNAKYYSEQAGISQAAIENMTVSAETVPDLDHGGEAQVIKTKDPITDIVNLHFKIPKGDVGDVYFMTFDIDTTTGELLMLKPDHMSPNVTFSLNNNDGNLYFEILN